MRRILFICLLALLFGTAQAANLDKGIEAFDNENWNDARYELEPLAEAGQPQAQFRIGLMHALGGGYRKDYVQAYKWLTLAARAGNADALEVRGRIASRMRKSQVRDGKAQANAFVPTPLATSAGSGAWLPPEDTLPSGRALVEQIQAGLSRLGYQPGPADGLMGQRTVSAISSFQRQIGMRADGKPSQDVLLAIRKAETDGVRAASPPPSASPVAVDARARDWYWARQDIDGVMGELRGLLANNDNKALRRGISILVERSDWPWNERVLRDDFSKSAGQGGLNWQVLRGEYAIDNGLLSDARRQQQAAASTDSDRKRSGKEQALEILGALLGARVERSTGSDSGRAAALAEPNEVRVTANVNASFMVRAKVLAEDPSGGTAFVLQRTVNGRAEELRLRYDAGAQQFRIEHATSKGVRVIASVALRFESANRYNLEWARRRDGSMQVAINGRLVISEARSKLRGRFETLAWRNFGGRWVLNEIDVHTRRR